MSRAQGTRIESSEEEEEEGRRGDIAAFTKYDESIEVRNAEEIESPASGRREMSRAKGASSAKGQPEADVRSPRSTDFRRYSVPDDSFNKGALGLDSETSESEESDELEDNKISKMNVANFYDAKQFQDLDVSTEVKELFQNITRYAPQKIELRYKLIPFIPDYIPAVGDIDAFLKVPRPDGAPEKVGLTMLDEPAAEQSEPAVLHLKLRSKSRSAAGAKQPSLVKRLEDATRQGKLIEKWIDDMGQLHRGQPPPAVQLVHRYPEPEVLLRQWPAEVEDKLSLGPPHLGFGRVDCGLLELVDLLCALLDIPVYGDCRIEALYTMFALYTEVHNVDIQTIH